MDKNRHFTRPQPGEENIHAGHRQRVFRKLKESGLDGQSTHQILELLLFFSIPRIDTNIIAHRLERKFGSIERVFAADEDELMSVSGIGKKSAAFIKLMSRVYKVMSEDPPLICLDTYDAFSEFCKSFDTEYKSASVVFIDSRMSICKMVDLEVDPNKDWWLPPETLRAIVRTRPVFFMLIVSCKGKIGDSVANLIDFYLRYFKELKIQDIEIVIIQDGLLKQARRSDLSNMPSGFNYTLFKHPVFYSQEVFNESDLYKRQTRGILVDHNDFLYTMKSDTRRNR